MTGSEIERLVQMLARLPGLGPRSGRRAALALLEKRETLLKPLIAGLENVEGAVIACGRCGNLDATDPCALCVNTKRTGLVAAYHQNKPAGRSRPLRDGGLPQLMRRQIQRCKQHLNHRCCLEPAALLRLPPAFLGG